MAVFNPGVPETNPTNFLGWSKPVDKPEPNQTGAILAKGAADILGTSINVTDSLIKKSLEDEVHGKVDKERGLMTSALEDEVDKARGGQPGISNPVKGFAGDDDLTGSESTDAPTDLQNLGSNIGLIGSARGNGKLTLTDYYGRLDTLAKDMRSRYPGYRDYIDKIFQKQTGVDPANARIRSLLGDLNSYQTSANAERNKWRNVIIQAGKEGIPGSVQMLEAFEAGRTDGPGIMRWMTPMKELNAAFEMKKHMREERKGNREEDMTSAESDAERIASTVADQYFNTIQEGSGVIKNPQSIADYVRDVQSGKVPQSDQQMELLGQKIMADRTSVVRESWKRLTDRVPGGRSILDVIGAKRAQEIVDKNMFLYDRIAKDIQDKETGAAFSNMRSAKARIEGDAKLGLLKDPKVGEYLTLSGALTGMGDVNNRQYFQHWLTLFSSMSPDWAEWVKASHLGMLVQPDLRNDKPVTIKERIDSIPPNVKPPPRAINELIDIAGDIGKPDVNDTNKVGLIHSAYSNNNLGLISKLTNNDKPEQAIQAFRKLTTEDNAKEVYRLSKADPTLWIMYKNWTEKSFGNEIFRKDILDLKDIAMEPTMYMTWKDNKFFVKSKSAGESGYVDNIAIVKENQMQRKLNHINAGIESLKTIAKLEGNNDPNYVDAYVVNMLSNMGFNPKDIDKLDRSNPIAHIIRSIANQFTIVNPEDPRRQRPKKDQ